MNKKLAWAAFSATMAVWCVLVALNTDLILVWWLNIVCFGVNVACVAGQLTLYWQRDVSAEKKARVIDALRSMVSE